ncbi:MAG TPA: hypothetical protein VHE61_08495 [Opitutaceae bacterium]|nr:hypothetical protein [Opitutaceae bacterium]
MSDPIEEHLVALLTRELGALGVTGAGVAILSAESEDWRFRVTADGRGFEAGFNHREQLWCREVTPGREAPLLSNDRPRIGTTAEARRTALRAIRDALAHPGLVVRDPPVI